MSSLRSSLAIGMAVTVAVLAVGNAFAQERVDDLREARDAARRDAAEAAARLDELSAEDADLQRALDALDRHLAFQQRRVRAAEDAIEQAEAAAAEAAQRAEALDDEIESIRERLRNRAVDAFVAPDPEATPLDTGDLLDAALRRSFLAQIVEDEYELVDRLRRAVAEQAEVEVEAEALVEEIAAQRIELEEGIAELEAARDEAERLRAEVGARIADWEIISDEIETADREMAEEIRRLEAEADRLAEEARLAELARLEQERRAEDAEPPADVTPDTVAPSDPAGPSAGGPGAFAITHRPVPGPITSPFGERVHPIFGTVRQHNGIDLDGVTGDPIVAGASGVVLSAGWRTGYGNTVVLSHGHGHTTLYAHMTDVAVATGATVQGGDLLGWVGTTGWTTGSHLHFEVRIDGEAVDPAAFF